MSEIDFNKYTNVDQIIEDIRKIKIQGATNVAIATFEGIKLFIETQDNSSPVEVLISEVEKKGIALAEARPNEPLAKNGLKFLSHMIRVKYPKMTTVQEIKDAYIKLSEEYLEIIKSAKHGIIENCADIIKDVDEIVTHCHSSTSETLIINQSKKKEHFTAVCSETRPLYQGRITATNLMKAGIDTTLVVDSAIETFIIGRGDRNADVIFLGCDEIMMSGDAINKIGSWGIAMAAYYSSKPLYVVGSILKTDVSTAYKPVEIEMRDAKELWEDAPEGLRLVNPTFEVINKEMITGYLTEVGLVKPDEIGKTIQEHYGWLF